MRLPALIMLLAIASSASSQTLGNITAEKARLVGDSSLCDSLDSMGERSRCHIRYEDLAVDECLRNSGCNTTCADDECNHGLCYNLYNMFAKLRGLAGMAGVLVFLVDMLYATMGGKLTPIYFAKRSAFYFAAITAASIALIFIGQWGMKCECSWGPDVISNFPAFSALVSICSYAIYLSLNFRIKTPSSP